MSCPTTVQLSSILSIFNRSLHVVRRRYLTGCAQPRPGPRPSRACALPRRRPAAAGGPGRRRRRRESRSGPQHRRWHGRRSHRIRTEVEPADLRVLIRVADELLEAAADGDALRRKARLLAVRAAGPTLAGETVAARHAHGIAGDHRLKLSTAAACAPFRHAPRGSSSGAHRHVAGRIGTSGVSLPAS